MSFIWYIIIGIVAGFLAGKIMRGGGFICLALHVGFVSACKHNRWETPLQEKYMSFRKWG